MVALTNALLEKQRAQSNDNVSAQILDQQKAVDPLARSRGGNRAHGPNRRIVAVMGAAPQL